MGGIIKAVFPQVFLYVDFQDSVHMVLLNDELRKVTFVYRDTPPSRLLVSPTHKTTVPVSPYLQFVGRPLNGSHLIIPSLAADDIDTYSLGAVGLNTHALDARTAIML